MTHPLARIPVASNTVLSYQYCPACQGLYVEFKGHRLYKYAPVTEAEWKSLRLAVNKQQWVHYRLKVNNRPCVFLGVDEPGDAHTAALAIAS